MHLVVIMIPDGDIHPHQTRMALVHLFHASKGKRHVDEEARIVSPPLAYQLKPQKGRPELLTKYIPTPGSLDWLLLAAPKKERKDTGRSNTCDSRGLNMYQIQPTSKTLAN